MKKINAAVLALAMLVSSVSMAQVDSKNLSPEQLSYIADALALETSALRAARESVDNKRAYENVADAVRGALEAFLNGKGDEKSLELAKATLEAQKVGKNQVDLAEEARRTR